MFSRFLKQSGLCSSPHVAYISALKVVLNLLISFHEKMEGVLFVVSFTKNNTPLTLRPENV